MTKKFLQKLRIRKNGFKKDLRVLSQLRIVFSMDNKEFSVSCRLRLQIYELFNELTSKSGTYNKRRILMAKMMKKQDPKLQKQQQGWPKISNPARKDNKDENLENYDSAEFQMYASTL